MVSIIDGENRSTRIYLEYGNNFVVAFTFSEIKEDQTFYFNELNINIGAYLK